MTDLDALAETSSDSGGGWQPQRATAARNREAIVRAAGKLFRERGVERVDIRDIAQAAHVGVGTIYRHFGDKGSVIAAVIGDRERRLQDALLSGPPPLGPGAPARERLLAFLRALARFTEDNSEVLSAAEAASGRARFHVGAYQAWRLHLIVLLRELNPELDGDWYADLLLAPLGAGLYRHHREQRGFSARRIEANMRRLIELVASPPSRGGEAPARRGADAEPA